MSEACGPGGRQKAVNFRVIEGGLSPLRGLAALIGNVRPIPPRLAEDDDPEPGQPRNGVPPGAWEPYADDLGLPPGCPVRPLGVSQSVPRFTVHCWFIDAMGQLRSLTPSSLYGRGHILSLFSPRVDFLRWAWPRRVRTTGAIEWRIDKVAEAMLRACYRKGLWEPPEIVGGRAVYRYGGEAKGR